MNAFERFFVLTQCQAWLGPALYRRQHEAAYLQVFAQLTRAARGEPVLGMADAARARALSAQWQVFIAVVEGAVLDAGMARQGHGAGAEGGGGSDSAGPADTTDARAPAALQPEVAELVPTQRLPRVPINSASARELADVPGIGPRVALRIVARRVAYGHYRSVDDLQPVQGLDRAARERAAPMLSFALPTPAPWPWPPGPRLPAGPSGPNTPVVLTIPNPTVMPTVAAGGVASSPLQRHIQWLAALRGAPPGAWPSLACDELRRIARAALQRPYWQALRRCDVPDLELRAAAQAWQAAVDASAADVASGSTGASGSAVSSGTIAANGAAAAGAALPPQGVAPLHNRSYFELIAQLIRNARVRAWVQMFYFTSGTGAAPGDALITELSAAQARGVDVRLILDTDLGSDYHRAATINAATVATLQAAGLAHRLDQPGATTHSKVLLIDERQVVVGSHNWTTRAAFQLEELSFYIESASANAQQQRRFMQLWQAYDPDAATRNFAFELLAFPSPAERRQLAAAGLIDSATLQARFADAAAAHAGAAALALDADRLQRLWRLLKLMQSLALPEATAHALTLTAAHSPAALLALPRAELLALLRALPADNGAYLRKAIRFDVVEALHG